jgi:protease-4
LKHALEHGPYTPQQAKDAGLIDVIGFEAEALKEAKEKAKTEREVRQFGKGASSSSDSGIGELIRLLAGTDERSGGRPHIAVVPAVGSITMQAGGPFGAPGITAHAMTKTLRRLRKDDSVKAVVLRLDSPGGSPLASDLIWYEVMELRKEKPVIASVGSMAASGGYYIACAAQTIVAERTSIVGSIGVFGGKIVLGSALQHVGVNAVTFPASKEEGAAERAAYLSPLTSWDDATRERVRAQMSHIYELFLQRVAKGRSSTVDKVRTHAEGAIFSGTQGKQNGLVDELGGLAHALDLARHLAKLESDAPVVVQGLQETLLEQLLVGEDASSAEVLTAIERRRAREAVVGELLPDSVRAQIGSVAPLVAGERVVAALPYALMVR